MGTGRDAVTTPPSPGGGERRPSGRPERLPARVRRFARAVRDGDETMVEELLLRLSSSRRGLGPLALAVGGVAMVFNGLKLLFSNWRLTLVQILPAMWIWAAMMDLKLHVLHGRSFNVLRGRILIPIVLAIAAITAACFFLNAVFGFAVIQGPEPKVRPAVLRARSNLAPILGTGAAMGLLLGLSTTVVTRAGSPWFALSLSVVVGLMMVFYVAIPSRLIGAKPSSTRRDRMAASAVGGALGVVVCTPPYLLARAGLLMLGTSALLIPGIICLAVGATLQAGATGAVTSVKMSTKLIAPDAPSEPPG